MLTDTPYSKTPGTSIHLHISKEPACPQPSAPPPWPPRPIFLAHFLHPPGGSIHYSVPESLYCCPQDTSSRPIKGRTESLPVLKPIVQARSPYMRHACSFVRKRTASPVVPPKRRKSATRVGFHRGCRCPLGGRRVRSLSISPLGARVRCTGVPCHVGVTSRGQSEAPQNAAECAESCADREWRPCAHVP